MRNKRLKVIRRSHGLLFLAFSFISIFLASSPVFSQSNNLTIGNYELVSSKRVTRTAWEYTYRAGITNNGITDTKNVTATVTSLVPTIIILDGSLSFGDIPVGVVGKSSDTFAIKIDRQYLFKESDLTWKISFEYTYQSTTQLASGLTQAVSSANIDEILRHFDPTVRDKYQDIFDANRAKLTELSQALTTLRVFQQKEKSAIYIFQFLDDDGTLLTNQILMKKGPDGFWKIISF